MISAPRGRAAALARRKVTAAEWDDYYRVVRSHGRTSLLRGTQRKEAYSTREEIPTAKTRARRKDRRWRTIVSPVPSLVRASRKSAPNSLSPSVSQGRARSRASPARGNRLFCKRDGQSP